MLLYAALSFRSYTLSSKNSTPTPTPSPIPTQLLVYLAHTMVTRKTKDVCRKGLIGELMYSFLLIITLHV